MSAETQTEDLVGGEIGGRYQVVRVIGKGGMGTVLEGRHKVTGRRVAIKRLNATSVRQKKALARFLQEAQATAAIGHPNIVQVLDAGEDGAGCPFLVFEYLEGCSLSSAMRVGGVSKTELVDIMIEVLEGLQAAHAAGFVHRDIKPDNIFVCEAPNDALNVKIVDFGISKNVLADVHITNTNMVVGTPLYMSPEQALGEKLDGRTDLWSVGAILFEAFTGRLPFEGCELNRLLLATVSTDAPPIRSLESSVSEPMAHVIDKALRRDRKARWPNARAMVNALLRSRAAEPGVVDISRVQVRSLDDADTLQQEKTSPTGEQVLHERPRPGRRAWLWAATIVMGLALSGSIVFGWESTRTSVATPATFAAPARSNVVRPQAPELPSVRGREMLTSVPDRERIEARE